MAKINRSNTTYVQLPEELATGTMPDAKCVVSINVLVPKGMEKSANDFIDDTHDEITKSFKKYIKKRIKKFLDNEV